jgi:hypothetical protein
VRRAYAADVAATAAQRDADVAADAGLAGIQQRLDVPHHGIEVQPLMQQIAIEAAEVLFPELLPLGQHELLELAMRLDQHQRRRRLERDPALDAENRVAQMNPAADAPLAGEGVQLGNQRRPGQGPPVERHRQAALEAERDLEGVGGLRGRLGQCPDVLTRRVPRVVELAPADGRPPQRDVDRQVGRARRDVHADGLQGRGGRRARDV